MTITLRVPEASPSQNEFNFAHWRRAFDSKKKWHRLITDALITEAAIRWLSLGAFWADGRRRLTVSRHGKRKLDPANLIGGLKGIIDCLVQMKLLVDDDDEHLELVAKNAPLQKGASPHTVLTLEDI